MREEKVAGAPADLPRFGQFDVRIACGLRESLRPLPCEEGGMSLVRAGPDPEIPTVVGQLIVQEQGREKRERARDRLAGLVAVDVRSPGPVVKRWDVQRDLGLLESDVEPVRPHQVSSELQDALRPLEHVEQRR